MPPETTKDAPATKAGRIFKVTRDVGPFRFLPGVGKEGQPGYVPPRPHIFSEEEFARVHPIPDHKKAFAALDPKTYHAELLDRLLLIGAIVEAPGETPLTTPGNPDGRTKNLGIASAAQAVLAERRSAEDQKAVDMKRLVDSQGRK